MSTCDRVDTVGWLGAGVDCIGDTGFGVLGSAIPSTGDNGPGYAYNDITLPADANTEICGRITVWPTHGALVAYEDTSFVYTATSDGADSFTYQLYKGGVASGSPITQTLQVGGTNATASGASLTGTASMAAGSASGTSPGGTNGSAPGATLTGSSSITGGAASGAISASAPGGSLAGAASISGGQPSTSSSTPGTNITGSGSISPGAASTAIPPLPVNPRMLYVAGSMTNFHSKRAAEREVFTVDFSPILAAGETINSAVWSIMAIDGIDANAGAMVSGEARPNGALVSQFIMGGIPGTTYAPICTAHTDAGQVLVLPDDGRGYLEITP